MRSDGLHPNFRNMTFDSEAFTYALNETLEILRIDLANFTLQLSDRYVDMLIPPSPGVYFRGFISPVLTFGNGETYFSASRDTAAGPDIRSFDDIWNVRGEIYDHEGQLRMVSIPWYKNSYTEYPYWHPAAIHIAYIYALETFRMHRAENNYNSPYSNLGQELLDLRRYVKPEYLPQFDGSYESYLQVRGARHFYDEDNEDLIELGRRIRQFIGDNRNSVFRCYLNNTTLIVERGNDYRVIEYYRMMMDHMNDISRRHHE